MRGRHPIAFALVFAFVAGLTACGDARAPGAPTGPPKVVLHPLPPPAMLDESAPGAAYLNALAAQIQPRWAQFLEDCRVRLAPSHALNDMTLVAIAELVIDHHGRVDVARIATSGSADFDLAVRDVLAETTTLGPPPVELQSDDDLVHLRWGFARDRRQAGARTAHLVRLELPLAEAIERWLARGELARAARRIAAAPTADPARHRTSERVMLAALREALGPSAAGARRSAIEAIGRVRATALAADVLPLVAGAVDREVRKAAISTLAEIGDTRAIQRLATSLEDELHADPEIAVAQTRALVALGQIDRVRAIVRRVLDTGPVLGALRAHAYAPDPAITGRLAAWFARGDAGVREAVCAAIPAAAAGVSSLVLRGLRDRDGSVRAACAETVARQRSTRGSGAALRRLHALARDRDHRVRARAVTALAIVDPDGVVSATSDPDAEVRRAAVPIASEAELRRLAGDLDPDVRAAALAQLGDRARALHDLAAVDAAPQVRSVVARTTDAAEILARLVADHAPEVASEALVRVVTLRGRAAMTSPLLAELAAAPAGSAERVRIALAWLAASR